VIWPYHSQPFVCSTESLLCTIWCSFCMQHQVMKRPYLKSTLTTTLVVRSVPSRGMKREIARRYTERTTSQSSSFHEKRKNSWLPAESWCDATNSCQQPSPTSVNRHSLVSHMKRSNRSFLLIHEKGKNSWLPAESWCDATNAATVRHPCQSTVGYPSVAVKGVLKGVVMSLPMSHHRLCWMMWMTFNCA
jgi:hypothetical protein